MSELIDLRGSGDERALTRRLLSTANVVLGRFACPPGHPLWSSTNHVGQAAVIAFPGTPVEISRSALGAVCADRNQAILYTPGQEYRRAVVDPRGDVCSYVVLSEALLADRRVEAVFRRGRCSVPPQVWLALQVARARTERLDQLGAEEQVLIAIDQLLEVATGPASAAAAARSQRRISRRIELVRERLSADLDDSLTVSGLAQELGMSPFHLARQFKRHTGSTLHAYRTQLRLRAAAQFVLDEPRCGLTDIATRLGFASHSHFTARFGRAFGTTPSGVRQSVGEPGLRKPAPTDAKTAPEAATAPTAPEAPQPPADAPPASA